MKNLILMRHAKTEKEVESGIDFDRILTERGKKDAILMANALKKNSYKPDFIVASPAKRASKTALLLAKELNHKTTNFDLDSTLYEAHLSDIVEVVRNFDDSYERILIVGHNPSITGIVGYLSNTFVEHIPTSGIVIISFPIKTWKMIQPQSGKVVWFQNPKNLPL